ncbi:tRNA dihydrouridine synthase DusB [Magnetococcales bacterium HHB-1]
MCKDDPIKHIFKQAKETKRPLLLLAPMAGITDAPFRALALRYGADLAISEMVASQAIIRQNRRSLQIASSSHAEPFFAIQIAGSDPEVMKQATIEALERGADLIDINMGCPAKKIVRTGSGAALLQDPPLAEKIIRTVISEAGDIPVTVKVRLGWDETRLNALEVGQRAADSGVRWITVHGRTRAQMYRGQADWKKIAELKQNLTIPVIGNGDIISAKQAYNLWQESSVDGLMVGRGALGRPWIFKQILNYLQKQVTPPEPNPLEKLSIAQEHTRALAKFYGEKQGHRIARKHLSWYSRGMKGSSQFRQKVNRCQSSEEACTLLRALFEQQSLTATPVTP